jgi:hypothetical protein
MAIIQTAKDVPELRQQLINKQLFDLENLRKIEPIAGERFDLDEINRILRTNRRLFEFRREDL